MTPPVVAPHLEAAVLTLVVVVGSTGHFATGSAVHLQGLRQVEFNA